MGTLTAATLAGGLSATQRDHRLHAVHAVLDLVVTGRVPPREVAAVMALCAGVADDPAGGVARGGDSGARRQWTS